MRQYASVKGYYGKSKTIFLGYFKVLFELSLNRKKD